LGGQVRLLPGTQKQAVFLFDKVKTNIFLRVRLGRTGSTPAGDTGFFWIRFSKGFLESFFIEPIASLRYY